jgi:hypothetical protein
MTSNEERPSGRSGYSRQHSARSASSCNNVSDARFVCNICYEAVNEPVVTQCGHLYCWPCIYEWLEPGMTISDRAGLTGLPTLSTAYNPNRRFCPTCRASCSVKGIVPIYVRTETPVRPIENNNQGGFRRGSNHSLLNEEIEVNHNRQNTNGEDDDEWLALSDDEDNNPAETTGLRSYAISIDRFRDSA